MIFRAQVFHLSDSLAVDTCGEPRSAPAIVGEALVSAAKPSSVRRAAASAWVKVVGIMRNVDLRKLSAPKSIRRQMTEPGMITKYGGRLVCISVFRPEELELQYEFIYNNGVEMWLICLKRAPEANQADGSNEML